MERVMAPARHRRGGKRGITLTEVAKLSGVSEITVSRVLRNKGAIADDTRKKVLLAVDQIGCIIHAERCRVHRRNVVV